MAEDTAKKSYYISAISYLSDRYGDLLIELMGNYNKNSLAEITEDEAEAYYNGIPEKEKKIRQAVKGEWTPAWVKSEGLINRE